MASADRPHVAIAGALTRVSSFARRKPGAILGILVVAVVVVSTIIALLRPLWSDELLTYYFSGLPSFGRLLSELKTGVDQTPPLFYIVTRATRDLFGATALGVRAPEILGAVLMTASTFRFVQRRAGTLPATVAVLLLLIATSFHYATEARPYELVIGCAAAALFCWQSAVGSGTHRSLAVAGFAAALAAAAEMHYYGIFIVFPFLVGELVRVWVRRTVDWPVAAGMLAGPLALLPARPLMAAARGHSEHFWSRPGIGQVVFFYRHLLAPGYVRAVAPGIIVTAPIATWALSRGPLGATIVDVPAHEVAALVAFVALPVVVNLISSVFTGAFIGRYAESAVLGVACLVGFATWQFERFAPIAGTILLCSFGVWSATALRDRIIAARNAARSRESVLAWLRQATEPDEPVVISSGHLFLELSHDVDRKGGPTLLYLADTLAAIRFLGTEIVDEGLLVLRRFAPLRVDSYASYLRRSRRFLLLGGGDWDWATRALRLDGADLRSIATFNDAYRGELTLFRVTT